MEKRSQPFLADLELESTFPSTQPSVAATSHFLSLCGDDCVPLPLPLVKAHKSTIKQILENRKICRNISFIGFFLCLFFPLPAKTNTKSMLAGLALYNSGINIKKMKGEGHSIFPDPKWRNMTLYGSKNRTVTLNHHPHFDF